MAVVDIEKFREACEMQMRKVGQVTAFRVMVREESIETGEMSTYV